MSFSYCTSDPWFYSLLRDFAKNNRKNPTMAERILWQYIRGKSLGCSFRRQHIIDIFIADFICIEEKLIIELDGGYHSLPQQQIGDEERTKRLNTLGYKVIRFTNDEVIGNIEGVINIIKQNLNYYGNK
ncbi:MAG TPA: cytosine methyltransferase [Prevotella sp.]|nr:cytosine methyltransferase [Prevotella sp.]